MYKLITALLNVAVKFLFIFIRRRHSSFLFLIRIEQ